METNISELAQVVDNAAKNAQSIEQLSLQNSITLKDAYTIQARSIERRIERGEELLGYKLGFTSKAKMEQMGVHDLIWGRLTTPMYVENGKSIDLSKFIHPRAEPEIAFRISKDIEQPISFDEAIDHIDGVACAIEVIDSRYKNFKFSLEDVIADNCSSSAYVIGEWNDPSMDISDIGMSMEINGQEVQAGNSSAILGHPLESLAEASRVLTKYGQTLKAGMVLLAGAATPAVFLENGNNVLVNCGPLGSCSLQVGDK